MILSKNFCRLFVPGFLMASPALLFGNPIGGTVTNGTATISGQGTANLSINQTSNAAIINWRSFSIRSGQTTQFLMPSGQSAVLNRVTGGSVSRINGRLSANGQVYLVNQNGIVVGPHGMINAASFTGSTRDIANSDFLSGNLHFKGNGTGTIINEGIINAGLGDVSLIGKTVVNRGKIKALHGTAALVAGDDVLLGQKNADGSTVVVNTSPLATAVSSTTTGVINSGSIRAVSAELKAAGGNIYALAINNSGTIRASTLSKQGGHIYLTASGGSLINSGTLNASSTVAKGTGGKVMLVNTGGTTTNSGQILATGGTLGTGGYAEISGNVLSLTGMVDLSGKGGTPGTLYIDPSYLVINSSGTGSAPYTTYMSASSVYGFSGLGSENVTLSSGNGITVNSALTWSSGYNLTFMTTAANSYVQLNAAITSTSSSSTGGVLAFDLPSTGMIYTSTGGAISVNNFALQGGNWSQNAPTLPSFSVAKNFTINTGAGATFLRAAGGAGTATSPYLITDVYGLQGVEGYLSSSFALANPIDASPTQYWNDGSGDLGFIAIGSSTSTPFTGNFNGNGYSISNVTANNNVSYSGYRSLFGVTGAGSTIANVNVAGGTFSGYNIMGSLVGINGGLVYNCTSSATLNPGGDSSANNTGGLVGINNGTVLNSSFTGSLSGYSSDFGGVVGTNNGLVSGCVFTGSLSGYATNMGGIVGTNNSLVTNSIFTGNIYGNRGTNLGGVVGNNTGTVSSSTSSGYIGALAYEANNSNVGGLVGVNSGTITSSTSSAYVGAFPYAGTSSNIGGVVGYNTGNVTNTSFTGTLMNGSYGITEVGGVAGNNAGLISLCYSTGSVNTGNQGTDVGGVAGLNNGTVTQSYNTGTVSGYTNLGGLVGNNYGVINQSYSTGTVSLYNYLVKPEVVHPFFSEDVVVVPLPAGSVVGGLVGINQSGGSIADSYSTGAVNVSSGSGYALGGLVGFNSGSITTSFAANSTISSNSTYVGGLVGMNAGGTVTSSFWMDPPGYGIGNPASNAGATPESLAALQNQATYQPVGTGSGYWNFTQGGVWTIIPGINNGLPVFQWQYGFSTVPGAPTPPTTTTTTTTPTTPSEPTFTIPYPLPINTPLPIYPNLLSALGVTSYLPYGQDGGGFVPGDPIYDEQDQDTSLSGEGFSIHHSITGIINDDGLSQLLFLAGQSFDMNGGPVPIFAQQILGQILDENVHDSLQAAMGGGPSGSLIHLGQYFSFNGAEITEAEKAELNQILGQPVLDTLLSAIHENKEQELILNGHYYTFHGESVPPAIRTQLDFMLSREVRDFLAAAVYSEGNGLGGASGKEHLILPGHSFQLNGGYNPPPGIQAELQSILDQSVRDKLTNALNH